MAPTPANPGEALWIGAAAGMSHYNVGIGQGTSQDANHDDFGQNEIEGGYTDPNKFFLNAERNVVFRINASAGRTSANTAHPRSELRELKTDGTGKAAWDGRSGVHWMRGRSRIIEVTTNRPWVCFGQIHGSEGSPEPSDLVRMQTEGSNGTSTNLQIVCRRSPPGGSEIRTVLRSGYNLGDWVSWEIRMDAGRLRIVLDGVTVLDVTGMGQIGNYFKAGCYLQDNVTKGADPSDWGAVEVERGSFATWHTGYPNPTTPVFTGPDGAGTGDTIPPTVPTNVAATPSGGNVVITWQASTDNVAVDHYIVWRDNGAGMVAIATVTGTTYTDTNPGNPGAGERTRGPGGVPAPAPGAGVTLITSDSGSTLSISSSGIWDGGGHSRPRIVVEADDVTVQNFVVHGGARDGISCRGENITIQNNDIYGITEDTGDMNAITFFGDGFKMLYNDIGVTAPLLSGSRGDAHIDAVQTWNNDPGEQSSNVEIIGNRIVGPPTSSDAYISQGVMAQGKGATDGGGGGTGTSANWLIIDNLFENHSENQIIKLDDIDDADLAGNKFSGSSGRVVHNTALSQGNTFWSSNVISGDYGQVGMTVTSGAGPPNPYGGSGGGTQVAAYAVSAVDTSGNESARSDGSGGGTGPVDTEPPTVPTGLAATPDDRRVVLTWTASTDDVAVVGYWVYRDGEQVGGAAGTTYVDTDLTNGATYSYRVSARDTANESAQSSPVTATPAAAPVGGVGFLPELPGSAVAVEVAWGADLTADSASWVWSDITEDVRHEQGISTALGRNDESSTSNPADLALVLDNSSGDYSLGGRSRHWPYVRRNTPIRVRVDPGDGAGGRVVFFGGANGWSPGWDSLSGRIPVVELSASGTLRRLAQGSAPVQSALRRALIASSSVVAYWPMEEGANSRLAPAVRGGSDMALVGRPDWAVSTDFYCSAPLPRLKDGVLTATVAPYETTGQTQVRFLMLLPESAEAVPFGAVLARIRTTGSVGLWDITYGVVGGTAPSLALHRYSSTGEGLGRDIGATVPNDVVSRVSLELAESGGSIAWKLVFTPAIPNVVARYFEGTVSGTVGRVASVELGTGRDLADTVLGHVTVENAVTSVFTDFAAQTAFEGEYTSSGSDPGGRMERLCRENAVPLTRYTADGYLRDIDRMGPQLVGPLLDLLREAEAANQGQLWDGRSAGLSYSTAARREHGLTRLVIDAAAGELAAGFAPVDDDQRTRNRIEVRRTHGITVEWSDVTGPAGTDVIGIYDDSVSINAQSDTTLIQHAQWRVSLGTFGGYRYPTVTVDLRASPQLAAAVLDLVPGDRVDVTNLDDTLAGFTAPTVSLLVEGISHELSPLHWLVTLRCSPFEPWAVGTVAAETGDTSDLVMRLDTDGSTLTSSRSLGATSLPVTSVGAPWTTSSDDYPLWLEVGGLPVRATSCSGTSGTQTITVDPLSAPCSSGDPVQLWQPRRVGMG